MSKLELIATSAFGLESIVAKELKELGFTDLKTENGKVTYTTNEEGLCKSNLWLRCADRVFIKIAEFKALSFEELFEQSKALPWADYLPEDANFIVNAKSVKSQLFSLSDIQSIVKKSIVEKMKDTYMKSWFEETGSKYPILVSILKDVVTVSIDTSGTALHKRGYREIANMAPMKETLAASLIKISNWTPDIPLMDPFCGSGTIAIEAALMGLNIAPGLGRKFVSETWDIIPSDFWKKVRKEAYSAIDYDKELKIYASDIDSKVLKIAMDNAEKAGVDDCIEFKNLDMNELQTDIKNGFIICNPPYGERLEEKHEIDKLYRQVGKVFKRLPSWSYFVITSDEDFQRLFGRKADKNRKLYNGRIKCYYYQYFSKK